MGTIGYGYGSEWDLLRYLGYHRKALNRYIGKAMGAETRGVAVDWLDSRFSLTRKALHDDHEFGGINFLQDSVIRNEWKRYWPASGTPPQWDAVGRLGGPGAEGE